MPATGEAMTYEPHACINGHDRKSGEVLHRIDGPDGYVFVCTGCWTIGGLLDLLPNDRKANPCP